jgi:CO dehydrogenase/acetyl-CoA synthase gamma subunit (corrinoid Fe-S protein)
MKMKLAKLWHPPGKDCGLCGNGSCREFVRSVINEEKAYDDCPFYRREKNESEEQVR